MAKIILNTNLANEDFVVEYKSIEVGLNKVLEKKQETVYITPVKGSTINAVDFSHGGLPRLISKIEFSNTSAIIDSSNKVAATVYFNPIKVTQRNNILFLPISGKSITLENKFNLIETCPKSKYLIKKERNSFKTESSLVNGQTVTKHIVKGKPNETVLIFQKGLGLMSGYYFAKEPSHEITGSVKGYTMRKNAIKNDQGKIIGEVFNLYFTFPPFEFDKKRDDKINFTYNAKLIESVLSEKVNSYTDEEEKNVYGIDTGRSIGPEGGEKKLRITGVPGSTFKLLVQNNAKQIYNFETGLFETGAPLFLGELPNANKGVAYGEIKLLVNVPPSTSGDDVIVNMISDTAINHERLAKAYDKASSIEPGSQAYEATPVTKAEEKITRVGSFVFSVHNGEETGFVISRPLLYNDKPDNVDNLLARDTRLKDGTYTIGDGSGLISEYMSSNPVFDVNKRELKYLTWVITTNATNKFIRINRQPRVNGVAYTRWDSAYESEDTKNSDSNGVVILTDFGNLDDDGSESAKLNYLGSTFSKSKVSVVGNKDSGTVEHGVTNPNDLDGFAFKEVIITLQPEGVFGTGTVSPELNLKNFLTIHTI